MKLEDRFYTSTEVAEILGVSLRSVYRYLEDGKLEADVKTATGRHRFTRDNILDFLYPDGRPESKKEEKKQEKDEQSVKADESSDSDEVQTDEEADDEEGTEEQDTEEEDTEGAEEDVDWLSKFRAAARKHREESDAQTESDDDDDDEDDDEDTVSEEPVKEDSDDKEVVSSLAEEEDEETDEKEAYYYKSGVGGLKELAQYINKTARKSDVEYAFTMNAGLSLHKLIRPFSTLHAYVRKDDKDFFEKALELTETDENNAQLALYIADDAGILNNKKEVHGLYVVDDMQLRKDLLDAGEVDLASELDEALNL